MNYTYIIQCCDGTFYTGWTTDLEKRIQEHNQGKGAKYTRGRTPVVLKYYEEFSSREEAMKREYYIKKLPRRAKEELIKDFSESHHLYDKNSPGC
ncbi:MAG: GIY-YIG nuclease family protein [Bacillota bacterium]|jgi:putative endonuclease